MNRMIWIWRFIAVAILIVFTILMWNLYARLTDLKEQGARPAAVETDATGSDQ